MMDIIDNFIESVKLNNSPAALVVFLFAATGVFICVCIFNSNKTCDNTKLKSIYSCAYIVYIYSGLYFGLVFKWKIALVFLMIWLIVFTRGWIFWLVKHMENQPVYKLKGFKIRCVSALSVTLIVFIVTELIAK